MDGCELPQLHTVKPDLWDPATSFGAHPGMPENVTLLGDVGWIGGLTKVMIYPGCTNQHQKIAVLAAPIQGLSRSRVVSYPVTCKQQKQTNLGCLGHPRVIMGEQIKNTSLSGCNLTPREAPR